MEKFYSKIIKAQKKILVLFAIFIVICALLSKLVVVNYDITDYLPENTDSTVALEVMREEFGGGIPNARVLVQNVSVQEALEYKQKLANIQGVTSVTWLDDNIDLTTSLSIANQDVVSQYYKNDAALFTLSIHEDYRVEAVDEIREIIGEGNAMMGNAVSTALSTMNTVKEVAKISIFSTVVIFIILFLTTTSYVEPLIILAGLGIAIVINNGTNILFGEVSFVTNAAGSILQLAVSLDYSVFLLHRFKECLESKNHMPKTAMIAALCKSTNAILSSGLTTVIGFLALVLMQFKIGPDLGLALAKGVGISLLSVFIFVPNLILLCYPIIKKTEHKSFMPSFKPFGKLITKVMIIACVIFGVVVAPSYLASNANSYYYGSSHMFSEDSDYGKDQELIEFIFGQNDSYVLMVPKGDSAIQKQLSDEIHQIKEVTSVLSYVDTVGTEIPYTYLDETTLSLLQSENYTRYVISVSTPHESDSTFNMIQNMRDIAQKYYPDSYHLVGGGVSTYDLKLTVIEDMTKVNLLAIGAVFAILVFTMKQIIAPLILVLCIEAAIWVNLAFPYFLDAPVFYLAYLIISAVQLGATVDYAILLSDRYKENRIVLNKKEAVSQTIEDVTVSVLTSGLTLTIVGFLLGYFSSNQLLAQLGVFLGRGGLCSLIIVLFVLPGLLYVFDKKVMGVKKCA